MVALHVQEAEIVLRLDVLLHSRRQEVRLGAVELAPLVEDPPDAEAGVGVALVGGEGEVTLRLGAVLLDALARIQHERQVILGLHIALVGRNPVELRCSGLILGDPVPVAVLSREDDDRIDVSQVGGPLQPCDRVLLVHGGDIPHGGQAAGLGRPPEPFQGPPGIGLGEHDAEVAHGTRIP